PCYTPPMPTRLFLVRHGGTLLSADDRFAGSPNVDLSEQGRSQAALLSRRLVRAPIAAIYCTDLKRTIDTASAIAARHTSKITQERAFREIDHGQWEGKTHREAQEQYPEE